MTAVYRYPRQIASILYVYKSMFGKSQFRNFCNVPYCNICKHCNISKIAPAMFLYHAGPLGRPGFPMNPGYPRLQISCQRGWHATCPWPIIAIMSTRIAFLPAEIGKTWIPGNSFSAGPGGSHTTECYRGYRSVANATV